MRSNNIGINKQNTKRKTFGNHKEKLKESYKY